ncbi:cation transporter [Hankyongella ginsenosidimutans]|uniref:Cation transporter n=1 Tax=Hankyongella ginsenosidimutans TaxID=1763828 RepID=A0A4D7C9X4_9SPHN|nr:heavy-metal-associated domain-containing protein [Hankyongella ginsenosidimutans]QCI79867.1 cation transporter [Hankyongella ginsenosidimutans]
MTALRILLAATLSLTPAVAQAQHTHDAAAHDHGRWRHPPNPPPAGAETAVVDVLGVVCDFCATALTKNFERRTEVSAARVDLDTKTLTLTFKPGQSMNDAQIGDLVIKSGYKLSAVRRSGAANEA